MNDNDLYGTLEDLIVDRVYGHDRPEPCCHGHLDCAVYDGGPCANEQYAKLSGQIEASIERDIDTRVQRILAVDRAYLNAEDAEEQATREAEIERMVTRDVVSRKIRTLSD